MGDWPNSLSGGRIVTANISASGTVINTKGLWVEVIAVVPYDCILHGSLNCAASYDYLIDLGIGAAGSEVSIINNIILNNAQGEHVNYPFIYPIFIPKGARLSVCVQSSYNGTAWADLSFYFIPIDRGSFAPLSSCVTYGANEADSGGTSIDPGSTIYTKGSWVQLTAATTRRTRVMVIGVGNQDHKDRQYEFWNVDIAITSSKNIIIPDYCIRSHAACDFVAPYASMPFPVDIPAGSEIWVRALCNINDSSDRKFDVVLYCFG